MVIFDEDMNELENPDLDNGILDSKYVSVYHQYVVDVPAEFHEEIVAEYPETGGKDVAIVYDVEEQGHWETRFTETGELTDFDGFIDDAWPRDALIEDAKEISIYRPLTQEEIEANKQYELAEQQRIENEQLVEAMPDLLCAMYEENLQLKETIDQQEEVLCAMYEELIQVKDDSAIAYAEATRPY